MDPVHDAAIATLTDRESSVSLEFELGPGGEIIRAHAPARFLEGKGE